jgi:hypothetical protein
MLIYLGLYKKNETVFKFLVKFIENECSISMKFTVKQLLRKLYLISNKLKDYIIVKKFFMFFVSKISKIFYKIFII